MKITGNHRGFTLLHILLTLLAISLIAGTGWYVWQAKNKKSDSAQNSSANNQTAAVDSFESCKAAGNPIQESYPEVCAAKDGKSYPNPAQVKEEDFWLLYEPPGKEFMFRVADGWKLYKKQDSNESFFSRTSLALQLGTKGEVLPFQSFGHGEGGCGLYWDWAKLSQQGYDEAVARSDEYYTDKITTSSGLEVKKSAGPGQGLYDASTKVYGYFLAKNLQTIYIGYAVCAGEPDHHEVVERVIKTINIR